jgi:cytochrome b6-f complex iron-sulfur subunit
MHPTSGGADAEPPAGRAGLPERRTFLAAATSLAMIGGLVASYGTAGLIAARYLFPARSRRLAWVFVAAVDRFAPGESLVYRSPAGERVTIARRGTAGGAEDFVALSSTCPHLGCQVHWEPQNTRFFCPCHNGVFDPSGRATSGPPADARQSLPRYALRVRDGLLYIQVPAEVLGRPAGSRRA